MHGLYGLEKYFNMEGFLEKSLKIKSALKSAGKWLQGLEKYLNKEDFLEKSWKIKSVFKSARK